MGWTNSVPIFHDDVTYILKEEIPDVTIPYIDDVPIKGPKSRYEKSDGTYEMIEENPGIRKFVWEHFQNLNRVVQRMKYCGGTFSGPKTVLCAEDIIVVGHCCTIDGRKPQVDRVGIISRWPDCKNITDIRMFLGTVGVCRNFIKDFAKFAEPLTKLLRKDVVFEWGESQKNSMNYLKSALKNAVPLGNINYESDGQVVLAVDTSWKAVGYYIYQEEPNTHKKKTYIKFGSITLHEREANFSQPKRELFGLKRALESNEYLLIGCRKLVVETDAKYIHGMLNHPEMGPNATINRWIEKILMFHFDLRHIPGKTFGPDGLSRREAQPGDELYPADENVGEVNRIPKLEITNGAKPPLDFEDFKVEIDIRGGYEQQLAKSVNCFSMEIEEAKYHCQIEQKALEKYLQKEKGAATKIAQYTNALLLPKDSKGMEEKYMENHRSITGKLQDEKLPLIKKWLEKPFIQPEGVDDQDYKKLVRTARRFFTDNNCLYRKNHMGEHRLVVEKDKRMYMMKASHDNLGHRGFYATKELIAKRFWWPEMEKDISWYCKTCHACQERQKLLVQIPPIITHTPSIFQVLHADTMHMTPKSNGCGYILHGCCGMTSWMEGRPSKDEKARTIAKWLFEDIVCRWGCLREIVTDNGSAYRAATAWLEEKYGIKGIKISPYNSKANGRIERKHWDLRQMLTKATGGDTSKWYWFFYHVLWADRITIRKRLGCSPFFMVTGAQPTLPLDILEATWLIKLPGRILSTAELIGYRAKALAKHRQHVIEMHDRIDAGKRIWLEKYEKDNSIAIKNFTFQSGDLVLIRNSEVESSLDRKMKPRYLGPMIIISKSKGGSYVIAELDGSVYHQKVAGFRVIPYFARAKVDLPDNSEELIRISKSTLKRIEETEEYKEEVLKRDFNFEDIKLIEQAEDTYLSDKNDT